MTRWQMASGNSGKRLNGRLPYAFDSLCGLAALLNEVRDTDGSPNQLSQSFEESGDGTLLPSPDSSKTE